MGTAKAIQLARGERLVPLSVAAPLLGAPSGAALLQRIYRAQDPAELGAQKMGGRWFIKIRDPEAKEPSG